MSKLVILFLATIVALSLVVTPVAAQDPTQFTSEDFAVRQSADSGDPYSFALIIVQESLRNPEHDVAFVTDPLQLLNVEHPEGYEGTIYGTFYTFDPELTFDEVLEESVDLADGMPMIYLGDEELPINTTWETHYSGSYWGVDLRANTEVTIEVPGSEWQWPSVVLSDDQVQCPINAACLYQSWNGQNAHIVYHVVIEGGETFYPWAELQGTLFIVTNFANTDIELLYARFLQMSQEVVIRDEGEDEMVVWQYWVGPNVQAPWIQITSASCTLTSKIEGLNVRQTADDAGAIVRNLEINETVVVIEIAESGWIQVGEGQFISPRARFELSEGCSE